MATSDYRFTRSPPFTFLVGPQRAKFYVHIDLAAQQSDVLKRMFGHEDEIKLKEAIEITATIENHDEHTFQRFLEFIYTGDYSVPEPMIKPAGVIETTGKVAPEDNTVKSNSTADIDLGWGEWGTSIKKKAKKHKKTRNDWFEEEPIDEPLDDSYAIAIAVDKRPKSEVAWQDFQNSAWTIPKESWTPRPNKHASESYSAVFLCHAQLYVFSDQYQIPSLADLTLQKLRLTLSKFTLFNERTSDIVDLLRYTVENVMSYEIGSDRLRGLLMDYVACKMDKLWDNRTFRTLLEENGEVAVDVLDRLMKQFK